MASLFGSFAITTSLLIVISLNVRSGDLTSLIITLAFDIITSIGWVINNLKIQIKGEIENEK